ncbi:MAG: type II secretion system protein [Symploca sp. SIO1B1]|nr:type II secretion system protein [Symploca sp. SIO2D2]NER92654.1 type II secretion system protein [Symploca sp. SIO1B1]
MLNSAFLKRLSKSQQNSVTSKPELSQRKSLPLQPQAGFTLIEVIVVVLMLGILAAIAAPSWTTFVNRRRVAAVNDEILRVLQEAQSKAKKTKLEYSVSFRTEDISNRPQVVIYPRNPDDTVIDPYAAGFDAWQNLGKELEIKSGQVLLGTNLDVEANRAVNNVTYDSNANQTITFDSLGALTSISEPNLGTNGLIITAAIPQPGTTDTAIDSTRKCVRVTTILGSLQTGQGAECEVTAPPANP